MIFIIIMYKPSFGDDFRLSGKVGFETGYDDNICFIPDTYIPDRDWFQTISAGLSMDHRTFRLEDHIEADVKQHLYLDTSELDTTDSLARADIAYAITDRLSTKAVAAYIKDSTIALDLTEGQNPAASAHRTVNALAGLKYTVGKNLMADINATYQNTVYDNSAYTDNFSGGLTFGMDWRADAFLPRTAFGLRAGYSSYRYSESELKQADYGNLQLSADWYTTAKLRIGISLGGALTRTRYEYTIFNPDSMYTEDDVETYNGMVGSINAVYTGENWGMALSGSHDIDMSSGASTIVQKTCAELDLSADITPKVTGILQATYTGYQSSQDDEATSSIYQHTISVKPVLRYKFADYLALNLSYNWIFCENRDPVLIYRRNIASVSIEALYPFFK